MMEKKQREQEKVEDKKVYSICRERKCRAEENKGTLVVAAGSGGGFGWTSCSGRTSMS